MDPFFLPCSSLFLWVYGMASLLALVSGVDLEPCLVGILLTLSSLLHEVRRLGSCEMKKMTKSRLMFQETKNHSSQTNWGVRAKQKTRSSLSFSTLFLFCSCLVGTRKQSEIRSFLLFSEILFWRNYCNFLNKRQLFTSYNQL